MDENDDKKVEWKEILEHYNITAEALQSLRKKRGRTEDEEKQVKVKLAHLKACLHRLCNLFATGSRLEKN